VSVDAIVSGIAARCSRLRTGLDVGFPDASASEILRARFPAVWMTVAVGDAGAVSASTRLGADSVHRLDKAGGLPFDGSQFDVAVLNGSIITTSLVREVHRVLKPAGFLFFTVEETVRRGPCCTLSTLYNTFLKSGYDIVSIVRPPWWRFGRDGRTLTVCAQKKNWREQRPLKGIGNKE